VIAHASQHASPSRLQHLDNNHAVAPATKAQRALFARPDATAEGCWLSAVKAGPLRELASSETCVLADLAESAAKCLLRALSVTGHDTNRRLSRGPVVPVRDGEPPHRLKGRPAQFGVTTISGPFCCAKRNKSAVSPPQAGSLYLAANLEPT
jgi:hypothetical protein